MTSRHDSTDLKEKIASHSSSCLTAPTMTASIGPLLPLQLDGIQAFN
jgi:hypothetical protein